MGIEFDEAVSAAFCGEQQRRFRMKLRTFWSISMAVAGLFALTGCDRGPSPGDLVVNELTGNNSPHASVMLRQPGPDEHKIWLFDAETGIARLIPGLSSHTPASGVGPERFIAVEGRTLRLRELHDDGETSVVTELSLPDTEGSLRSLTFIASDLWPLEADAIGYAFIESESRPSEDPVKHAESDFFIVGLYNDDSARLMAEGVVMSASFHFYKGGVFRAISGVQVCHEVRLSLRADRAGFSVEDEVFTMESPDDLAGSGFARFAGDTPIWSVVDQNIIRFGDGETHTVPVSLVLHIYSGRASHMILSDDHALFFSDDFRLLHSERFRSYVYFMVIPWSDRDADRYTVLHGRELLTFTVRDGAVERSKGRLKLIR